MAHKVNKTDAFMLLGGSVVGAGIGLLLAPCAGVKSRKKIVKLSRTFGKTSERAISDFTDTVSNLADTISGKAAGVLHKF